MIHPQDSLTRISCLPAPLLERVNYPGQARYLELAVGPGNELWYDDGNYTGVTRLTLDYLLVQPAVASYAVYFQTHGAGVPRFPCFLLDRSTQELFLGGSEEVVALLRCNVHPSVFFLQGGADFICHESFPS